MDIFKALGSRNPVCPVCLNHTPQTLAHKRCPSPVRIPGPAKVMDKLLDGVPLRCQCKEIGSFTTQEIELETLQRSYERGCHLCSLVLRSLRALQDTGTLANDMGHVPFQYSLNVKSGVVVGLGTFATHVNIRRTQKACSFWGPTPCQVPLGAHHDSDECFEWLRLRLATCETEHQHEGCREATTARLPTRVIDVGLGGTPPRLVDGRGATAVYIALSHCWGGEPGLKTTRDTLASRLTGLDMALAPNTFQDAIHVARKLLMQYIWIDALCIIQDDTEDWEREAAMMSEVYSNAYFVLSAIVAVGDSEGFLLPLRGRWAPRRLESVEDSGTADTIVQARKLDLSTQAVDRLRPTHSRAWCFQELLLARRVVSYENACLVFSCSDGCTDDEGWNRARESEYLRMLLSDKIRGGNWLNEQEWMQVVSEYTSRNLTHSSDRLPALSGVAARVNEHRGRKYLAGLWVDHLPWALLWYSVGSPGFSIQQSPSFSWCTTGCTVQGSPLKPDDDFHIMVKIAEADCYGQSANPYGQVSWGFMRLSGSVYTAEFSWGSWNGRPDHWRLSLVYDLLPAKESGQDWHCDPFDGGIKPDTHLIARRPDSGIDELPYLSRKRDSEDIGCRSTKAAAHLLLVGRSKSSRFSEYGGPLFVFLILGPTERHEGCNIESLVFERIGIYNVRGSSDNRLRSGTSAREREVIII